MASDANKFILASWVWFSECTIICGKWRSLGHSHTRPAFSLKRPPFRTWKIMNKTQTKIHCQPAWVVRKYSIPPKMQFESKGWWLIINFQGTMYFQTKPHRHAQVHQHHHQSGQIIIYNSLTWILRPFGDDSPQSNYDFQGSLAVSSWSNLPRYIQTATTSLNAAACQPKSTNLRQMGSDGLTWPAAPGKTKTANRFCEWTLDPAEDAMAQAWSHGLQDEARVCDS